MLHTAPGLSPGFSLIVLDLALVRLTALGPHRAKPGRKTTASVWFTK